VIVNKANLADPAATINTSADFATSAIFFVRLLQNTTVAPLFIIDNPIGSPTDLLFKPLGIAQQINRSMKIKQ